MLEIHGIVALLSDKGDLDGSGDVVDHFWMVNVGC
jgi:hypothetical protein